MPSDTEESTKISTEEDLSFNDSKVRPNKRTKVAFSSLGVLKDNRWLWCMLGVEVQEHVDSQGSPLDPEEHFPPVKQFDVSLDGSVSDK